MSVFYVGITDSNWFSFLQEDYNNGILSSKVNFWMPGTKEFKVLESGDLFLFKLHNKKSTGENGCESLGIMKKSLKGMQEKINAQSNDEIGCIILERAIWSCE